jgi:hypothetical protein
MLAIIQCTIFFFFFAIQKYEDNIYRNISLLGSETWSVTLRKKRRLRVSENRVMRRIFGPKRGKVTGSGEN